MAMRNGALTKASDKSRGYVQTAVILLCLQSSLPLSGKEEAKHTSSFNQEWLKTLVSIEVSEPNKDARPIGSGFLVLTPSKRIALVTAKHVVFDMDKGGTQRPWLAYRMNRKEGRSDLLTEAEVGKYTPASWFKSDTYDVACRLMIWREISDLKAIEYSQFLVTPKIEPGAPIHIIGFPMGLRSKEYAVPILRRGMIAHTASGTLLADGFVFPGNSGGPVVYAPEGTIRSSTVLGGQWLAGLVSSYVPYVDVAISPQTRHSRITFEENSGLFKVVPASAVLELLESPPFVAVDMKEGMK